MPVSPSRVVAALAGALILAAAATPGAAAKFCTWGQPGYRTCVEGKVAERRRAGAEGERKTYRTAPARRRPGTLTPVDPAPFELGRPDAGAPRRAPSQEQRLDAISRDNIRRDAIPNPIMPPNPNANTIPGRICPPLGC